MNFDNQAIMAQLQKNHHLYLGLGIGLVALGTLAILFAYTATLFSIIYLAGFFLAIGAFEVVQAFKMHFWSKFFLHAILAALYLFVGGFMLWNPMLNAITLTLFLAFFFALSGFLRIIFALAHDLPHRGWIIFNGIISIVLGFLIWQQWPASGLWVIGLFVGINAIFTGWSLIILASQVKKIKN